MTVRWAMCLPESGGCLLAKDLRYFQRCSY